MAELPKAYAAITEFIRENPLLCGALFISYALIYMQPPGCESPLLELLDEQR